MISTASKAMLFVLLVSCNIPETNSKTEIMLNNETILTEQNRFVLVPYENGSGTRSFRSWYVEDPHYTAMFLAKLWYLFGEPQHVGFEGFDYTIQDTKTGLIFTAYCAGSGPSFGGNYEDFERLESVINEFEDVLETTPYADCEIEFESDFGIIICGSKHNTPYMLMK